MSLKKNPVLLLLLNSFFLSAQTTDTIWTEADEVYIYETYYEEKLAEVAPYQILQDSTGRKGVYNYRKRAWSLPPVYDNILWHRPYLPGTPPEVKNDQTFLRIYREGLQGLVTKFGDEVIPLKYQTIENVSPEYDNLSIWRVKNQEGRYGLISVDEGVLLPEIYEQVFFSKSDQLYEAELKGKRMKINKKGEIVVPPDWFSLPVGEQPDGTPVYRVRHQGLLGCINEKNEQLLPFQFEGISRLTLEYYRVIHPTQGAGLYDLDFNVVVPCQYQSLKVITPPQINGWYLNSKKYNLLKQERGDSLYAFIDAQGNALSPAAFHDPEKIRIWGEVVFDVVAAGQWVAKSKSGDVLMRDTFTEVSVVRGSRDNIQALLQKGNTYLTVCQSSRQCALLDMQVMKTLTPYQFDYFTTPASRGDNPIQLVLGVKGNQSFLFRLDGTQLSDIGFAEVRLSSNYSDDGGELRRKYPTVEAIMKTSDGQQYILADDKVQAME